MVCILLLIMMITIKMTILETALMNQEGGECCHILAT